MKQGILGLWSNASALPAHAKEQVKGEEEQCYAVHRSHLGGCRQSHLGASTCLHCMSAWKKQIPAHQVRSQKERPSEAPHAQQALKDNRGLLCLQAHSSKLTSGSVRHVCVFKTVMCRVHAWVPWLNIGGLADAMIKQGPCTVWGMPSVSCVSLGQARAEALKGHSWSARMPAGGHHHTFFS